MGHVGCRGELCVGVLGSFFVGYCVCGLGVPVSGLGADCDLFTHGKLLR